MQLRINPGDEVPIYRQIVHQIRAAVASGYLKSGDRLASHRELGEELVVAPLTVKKAYDVLEQDRVVETVRGRGTFVRAAAARRNLTVESDKLRDLARRLVTQALLCRVSQKELHAILKEVRQEFERSLKVTSP